MTEENQIAPVFPKYKATMSYEPFCCAMYDLSERATDFAKKRLWHEYDELRNLALALLGEVGELAAMVPWFAKKSWDPQQQRLQPRELGKVSQELADVAIYSLRIAVNCEIIYLVRKRLRMMNTVVDLTMSGASESSEDEKNEEEESIEEEKDEEDEAVEETRQFRMKVDKANREN